MAESASPTFTPPPPSPWPRRFGVAVVAALLIGGIWWGWLSWTSGWMPDRARWPTQGVAVGAANEPVDWARLADGGASFVYVDATDGAEEVSPRYTAEHDAAVAAGLRVGAIHRFDICALASEQAAAFVRLVPREANALPPAVMLDFSARCERRPTKALLLTELTTFLTQVETHMGKAAVVSPGADIEADYGVAEAVNRALWLRSNRSEPAPEAGQWTIWQANDAALVAGSTGPTRWLVANDGSGMVQTGGTQ